MSPKHLPLQKNLKYPNKAENRCAYKNCNNRRGDKGVVLFCFPNKEKNPEKYNKWCHNAGINKERAGWRLMICNTHFHGEDYTTYEYQKLLSRAIPLDYRLVEKDVPSFDPTKVERVYANNSCTKIIDFIKSEIKAEIIEDNSDTETSILPD